MTKTEELVALTNGRGCFARSAPDEPLFILCARDVLASDAIREWVRLAKAIDVSDAKVTEAEDLANAMDVWRTRHGGGKVPD